LVIASAPKFARGSAPEAFLFDDVQLQVLPQLGEWAAPRTDRNRNRRTEDAIRCLKRHLTRRIWHHHTSNLLT
jgi:hypothetical protein